MSLTKSITAFGVRTVAGKAIGGESLKRSAKVGVVLGVSSYLSGSVIGMIPIPSIWGWLGAYSSDVVASVLTATVHAFYLKQKGEGVSKSRVFLRELLYSFGSCLAGDMLQAPINNLVSATQVSA